MKGEQAVLAHYHDYPDAEAGSYKRLRLEDPPREELPSMKVLETKKQVAQQERERVREQERLKKIRYNEEAQKALKYSIEAKKKEMEQLEIQKRLSEEEQVRSYELAKFKEQEIRDLLIKKEEQKKLHARAAKQRAEQAGKRLVAEKEHAEAKEKEAAYRRKVIQEAEKDNRAQAIKWQETINANRPEPEEPVEFERFYKPLGRVNYNRNVDYTKTRLHNPILVKHNSPPQQDEPEQTAIDKAMEVEEQIQKMKLERQLSQEQLRQRSKERGRQALRKLQEDKIQDQVSKEAQDKLREYNLQKVEQGKRDQYLGLKPGTLAQMELNKKMRSEREFEDMFFRDRKLHWVSEPANKYQIADNRSNLEMKSSITSKTGGSAKNLKGSGYVPKKIEESVIPNESGSKYSFNDDNILADDDMIRTKPRNIEEFVEEKSPISQKDAHDSGTKHGMEKTREPFERPERFPGSYKEEVNRGPSAMQDTKKSSSKKPQEVDEDEKKQQREKIRQFIKMNEQYLKNAEKQRRVVFKGSENVRQGENMESSPPNYMDSLLKSTQTQKNKSKLSNICENKDHSDLDYSQDSDHHEQ